MSYLLITLSFDWTTQIWTASKLLYHLTELFKYELPINYFTIWLNY